jgi:tRNA dimethylallyltransferase
MSRNDMYQRLNSAIHDFAKRQENWFRKMEKNGVHIQWVAGAGDPREEAQLILRGHQLSAALTP